MYCDKVGTQGRDVLHDVDGSPTRISGYRHIGSFKPGDGMDRFNWEHRDHRPQGRVGVRFRQCLVQINRNESIFPFSHPCSKTLSFLIHAVIFFPFSHPCSNILSFLIHAVILFPFSNPCSNIFSFLSSMQSYTFNSHIQACSILLILSSMQ